LLETNLEFFSSSSSESSLLDDAKAKLERKNNEKGQWRQKLKELNVIKHRIEKENEEHTQAEESSSDDIDTAD
jgi:hypothetical protein